MLYRCGVSGLGFGRVYKVSEAQWYLGMKRQVVERA